MDPADVMRLLRQKNAEALAEKAEAEAALARVRARVETAVRAMNATVVRLRDLLEPLVHVPFKIEHNPESKVVLFHREVDPPGYARPKFYDEFMAGKHDADRRPRLGMFLARDLARFRQTAPSDSDWRERFVVQAVPFLASPDELTVWVVKYIKCPPQDDSQDPVPYEPAQGLTAAEAAEHVVEVLAPYAVLGDTDPPPPRGPTRNLELE